MRPLESADQGCELEDPALGGGVCVCVCEKEHLSIHEALSKLPLFILSCEVASRWEGGKAQLL